MYMKVTVHDNDFIDILGKLAPSLQDYLSVYLSRYSILDLNLEELKPHIHDVLFGLLNIKYKLNNTVCADSTSKYIKENLEVAIVDEAVDSNFCNLYIDLDNIGNETYGHFFF